MYDVIRIANVKLYSRKYSDAKKLCAQHSITVAHVIKAFMIPKTSYFSVVVRYLDVSLPTVHYKRAQKLKSLLTLIMATVYKSLPGKHLA